VDARRVAGWLAERGLRRGDRVAVVATNRPGYVEFVLGALRSGVVPVPVNPRLPRAQRDAIVTDADVALSVGDDRWPSWVHAAPAELSPYPLARPMHFTSGTTGAPKGVWSGVFDDETAQAFAADERDLWAPEPGDTYLVVSPLHHSAPLRSAISALLSGASVVVAEAWDTGEVAGALRTATGAFLVPTHLRRLLEHRFEAPAARKVLHAGEACPDEIKERSLEVFPEGALWEFYGSTEGQFTALAPGEWPDHRGSVGRARPGRRLEIADAGADGVGAVWVTAPPGWRWEYWREPDKTARAWRGDTFTVGDVGRLDDEGYLYLAGRREDLIISGGVNVYPAVVEGVLAQHPDVVEVAVFGVPDREWGQRVCAAVVSRAASAGEIAAWARDRLGPADRPKEIVMMDALPRTSTGKILRTELAGGFAS